MALALRCSYRKPALPVRVSRSSFFWAGNDLERHLVTEATLDVKAVRIASKHAPLAKVIPVVGRPGLIGEVADTRRALNVRVIACSAKSASNVFAVCQAALHAHEARGVPEEGSDRRVVKFADSHRTRNDGVCRAGNACVGLLPTEAALRVHAIGPAPRLLVVQLASLVPEEGKCWRLEKRATFCRSEEVWNTWSHRMQINQLVCQHKSHESIKHYDLTGRC